MADPEPESDTTLLQRLEWTDFSSTGIYVASFLLLVGLVGAVGNLHVLLVYFRSMRHTTYRVFVMVLCTVDLLGSTLSIVFVILELRYPLLFSSSELCKVSRMIIYFVATFSLCLLDIIALERLWIICRPLGCRTRPRGAIVICLVSAMCTFCLVSIPVAFIYGSDQRPTSVATLICCECTVLGYLRRPVLGVVYQLSLVTLFTVLLFTCIGTYAYIYRTLKRVMLDDSNLRVHSLHLHNHHHHRGKRTKGNKKRSNRSESIAELCIVSESSLNSDHSDISTTLQTTDYAKEVDKRTTLDNTYSDISLHSKTTEKENDSGHRHVRNSNQATTLCSHDVTTLCSHDVTTSCSHDVTENVKDVVPTLRVHVKNIQTLRKAVNATRMFLVISILSFFTSLPYFVLAALRNLDWDVYFALDENFGPLDEFLTSLMFLNHATNPVIYGFMDKKLRKGCIQMYRQLFHVFKQSRQ